MAVFKRNLSGHLLAKSHRYIYIYIKEMRDTAKYRLNRYVPLRRVWFSRFLLSGMEYIETREFGSRIGYYFPVILSIMVED